MFLVTMEAHVAPELEERLIHAFDHVKSRRRQAWSKVY